MAHSDRVYDILAALEQTEFTAQEVMVILEDYIKAERVKDGEHNVHKWMNTLTAKGMAVKTRERGRVKWTLK